MAEKIVYVSKNSEYDVGKICLSLASAFETLGIDLSDFKDKKVVIKPNLVMKKSPDGAATTHPAVIDALLTLLDGAGVKAVIAESPGGVYSAARLMSVYRGCGIESAAEKHGCALNTDTSFKKMSCDGGKTSKMFDIISPIADADVIFDVCKLKSHSLTKMSAAAKNLYGTVPGVVKFEMHAAYPDIKDFTSMLCDLCSMMCEKKTVVSVTDGIVGMEGEGPTGGTPKKIGAILVSRDPFASDVVSAKLLGLKMGDVPLLAEAASRGLIPSDEEKIEVVGDGTDGLVLSDFVLPRSQTLGALTFFSSGKIGKIFMPHPKVTEKCRACGECVASCPQHTISIEKGRAKINRKKCIRCYCCQELCPFVAIKTARNPIIDLINKLK